MGGSDSSPPTNCQQDFSVRIGTKIEIEMGPISHGTKGKNFDIADIYGGYQNINMLRKFVEWKSIKIKLIKIFLNHHELY